MTTYVVDMISIKKKTFKRSEQLFAPENILYYKNSTTILDRKLSNHRTPLLLSYTVMGLAR